MENKYEDGFLNIEIDLDEDFFFDLGFGEKAEQKKDVSGEEPESYSNEWGFW